MAALALLAFGWTSLAFGGPQTPPTYDAQVAASTAKGEWITNGGDAGFQRYAPLDQINAQNVGKMEIVWRARLNPVSGGADTNNIASPLMVDGVLYMMHGTLQVSAMDPETGEAKWTYTPPPYKTDRPGGLRASRSLAYWTDGKAKRLFENTTDGRLISVDPATGKADPNFGFEGQVFLVHDLGRFAPHVTSNSPPTVVGDIVVAQIVGDLTAPQKEATPGFIRGYDVHTGKLVWTFHTIPQRGEFGNDTWGEGSAEYSGNTDVWTMMSADEKLGYIYIPVGDATNDFYGGHRPGANLYADSIVCLDARTGKRIWHFQLTHHPLWDYDPPAAPILHDVVVNGKRIKAVTVLTKQGFQFVFDRVTGKPVWPIVEKPAPQLPIPGDKQWPTQPFPTKPASIMKMGYDENELIDFTPDIKRQAIAIAEQYERGPLYTPPTPKRDGKIGTWVLPSMQGGPNWPGGAFDPDTGMLYVPSRVLPYGAYLEPGNPMVTDMRFTRPTSVIIQGPYGLPINKPPWSTLTATNMNRGDQIWQIPIGGAPDKVRNNPALKGLNLDFDHMGKWNIRPGLVATKTLVFMSEAGGYGDPGGPMFRAYDKATGKVVAEIQLPSLASGAPMTYVYKGRQYIAITVSSQTHPAELVAMALPNGKPTVQSGPVVPLTVRTAAPAAAPSAAASSLVAKQMADGRQIYATACAACHGVRGEGTPGETPGLANVSDYDTVLTKVANGGFSMPSLQSTLSVDQMAAVSRYVANGGLKGAP